MSKQKPLQGLDNTSTAGEEAFKTIASVVENLVRHPSIFKRWKELSQKRIQESCRTSRALC